MSYFDKYIKFDSKEFDSPDVKDSGLNMEEEFIAKLHEARLIANIPFVINSGFRTIEHNEKVGGSQNSAHLRGWAADIKCVSSGARFKILAALIQVGFKRIGIANGFIHVDCDPGLPGEVVWKY